METHVPSSSVEDKITTTQEHYTTAFLSFNEEREADGPWRTFPRIHRVHPKLRGQHHVYDPAVLSLGPYHHGKSEFRHTEDFKTEVLNMAFREEEYDTLYKVIFNRIGEIRRHYDEVGCDDETLASIILRDSCFLIHWMTNSDKVTNVIIERLGASMAVLLVRDICMLENQIPSCVIEELLSATIYAVSRLSCTDQVNVHDFPVVQEISCREQPHKSLHILQAYHISLIGREITFDESTVDEFKLSFSNSENELLHEPPNFFRLIVLCDEKLAWIILRDSCFLIKWAENSDEVTDLITERLGSSMALLVSRDIYLLENQIPHCVIRQLCNKRFDRPGMDDVVSTLYFTDEVNPVLEPEGSCKKQPHKPLHFLEAYPTQLVGHL